MIPDEDIAYEMNRELGQAEQREIARRVERALTDHGDPGADLPEPRTDGGTMSDRLREIEGRLANATKGRWEVVSTLNQDGRGWTYGVALAQDYEVDICELPHTPQGAEDVELIAHAPADLAALVKFAREVEALHQREDDVDSHGKPYATCSRCLSILGEHVDWPCATGAALERMRAAS